jgi:dephospho-CoA kinase
MGPRALRVGLTGGIASGKSHVLRRLAADGFHTLDLDRVAHGLMAPGGAAYADVAAAFGPGILASDGTIDRGALGAIVFADPGRRLQLNALVHPRVREAEEDWLRRVPADAAAVVDAALLVETGLHLRFDRLVVVRCTPEQQRERLRHRDGLDAAAAEARLRAQMDPADKARFAHFEVDSSGRPADTDAAVDALAGLLRGLAGRTPRQAPAAAVAAGWWARLGTGAAPLPTPTDVRAAGERGGLELPILQGRLRPPRGGPWHDAPGPDPAPGGDTWAAAAAVGVVAAEHRPGDLDWAAAAGYALGRLGFADPAAHAGTAHVAVAACDAASGGAAAGADARARAAERFSPAPPPTTATAFAAAVAG